MINVRNYLWLKTVNVWQSKSNLIECNYERGAEMTAEEKRKGWYQRTKTCWNGYSVRTSAHWKSLGNAEFYIKEMYEKFDALAEIDRLFHWSSRLHQEQLQFVSKYPKVMEKYRQSN